MKTKGVRQTGRGWEASIQVNGIRKTAMRQTKAEAIAVRKELERLLLLEQRSKPDPKGFASTVTLADACKTTLEDKWVQSKSRRTYESDIRLICDFLGGDTLLEAICYEDLVAMQNYFLNKGSAVATIERKISTIRTVFKESKRVSHITKIPEFPNKLKGRKKAKRIFSLKEERQFINWFRDNGHHEEADVFIFLLDTCARWGEIEKLKVWDVCLTTKTVTFEDRKKNNLGSVPLSKRALSIAKKYHHRKDFFFNGPDVDQLSYRQFRYLFEKCRESLGINNNGQAVLTIHSTRHTCVSRLAMANHSERLLMQFGGWTDNQALDAYIHLSTDSLLCCVDTLDSYHDGSMEALEG